MLIRPVTLNPAPSIVVLMFGGLVGAVLALGVLYGAPVAGWPRLDALGALGGIFSDDAGVALAAGAVVMLAAATLLLPLAPLALSTVLPAPHDTIRGAVVNGLVLAGAHWAIVGVILGIAALLGTGAAAGVTPGFMGFSAGLVGAVLFAVASVLYGLSVTIFAFMEQGISPFDAIGWGGFSHAATGPVDLGVHRSGEPAAPGPGERPWRG